MCSYKNPLGVSIMDLPDDIISYIVFNYLSPKDAYNFLSSCKKFTVDSDLCKLYHLKIQGIYPPYRIDMDYFSCGHDWCLEYLANNVNIIQQLSDSYMEYLIVTQNWKIFMFILDRIPDRYRPYYGQLFVQTLIWNSQSMDTTILNKIYAKYFYDYRFCFNDCKLIKRIVSTNSHLLMQMIVDNTNITTFSCGDFMLWSDNSFHHDLMECNKNSLHSIWNYPIYPFNKAFLILSDFLLPRLTNDYTYWCDIKVTILCFLLMTSIKYEDVYNNLLYYWDEGYFTEQMFKLLKRPLTRCIYELFKIKQHEELIKRCSVNLISEVIMQAHHYTLNSDLYTYLCSKIQLRTLSSGYYTKILKILCERCNSDLAEILYPYIDFDNWDNHSKILADYIHQYNATWLLDNLQRDNYFHYHRIEDKLKQLSKNISQHEHTITIKVDSILTK